MKKKKQVVKPDEPVTEGDLTKEIEEILKHQREKKAKKESDTEEE